MSGKVPKDIEHRLCEMLAQRQPELREDRQANDVNDGPVPGRDKLRSRAVEVSRPQNPRLTFEDLSGLFDDHERRRIENAFLAVSAFHEMTDPDSSEVYGVGDAKALYEYLFPNPDEAESWEDVILPRVQKMRDLPNSPSLQKKYGDSRFHAVVCHKDGEVVAYTQFSTLPLLDESGKKDKVVVFTQYSGVADRKFMSERYKKKGSFRGQGIASAQYALRHALAARDAKEMGYENGVFGTIGEAEMVGQALDADDIRFTSERFDFRRKLGTKLMMLKMPDGTMRSAHLQPRLSKDSEPIKLLMLFRPLHYDPAKFEEEEIMDLKFAERVVMSYVDNFDREGFDPKDVDFARQYLKELFSQAAQVVLMPPSKVPNIAELARHDPMLKEQVERDYGSIEGHAKRIKAALAQHRNPEARNLGS